MEILCSSRVAELCEKISKLHSTGIVPQKYALHRTKLENSGLALNVNGIFDDTDDEEKLVFISRVN